VTYSKRLRFYSNLLLAFLSRFKLVILASIFGGAILFVLIGILAPKIFSKRTEIIGVAGRYDINTLPWFILGEIGQGLTSLNATNTPEPALASSWETPDAGKTWTFTIKNGAIWQDGQPVKSDDINYQFTDVEIKRLDDKNISFSLKDPFVPFPAVVSKPVFKKGLLGTGEWKVSDISLVGGNISKLVLTSKDKSKRIYKFYPTTERTILAFKRGEINEISYAYELSPFDKWNNVHIEETDNNEQVVTLFINTKDADLSDKSARQALAYAIDKTSFNKERALSPISPNSWAYNSQVKSYTYDIDRAKELIKNITDRDDNPEIKLASTPTLLPVAEKIADYWNELGINTSVQVTSVIPSEFQVFLAVFDIPKDPDQYSFWHSTQETTNITNYANPRIDKLLEDGRSELNVEERKKIYLDFQRFLVEDSPAIFLYHPKVYNIIRK
jgi:peptide/nickel transport system substrate-binding protein